jgi:hypothetical protein
LKKEVDDLIEQCRENSIRRAAQLVPLPPEAVASLTRLWEEVRRSFILGEYSAALALGCAFLEFALERAVGSSNEMTLHNAIEKAKAAGLIDSSMADRLLETKERIRNAYAHGDYNKIARPDRVVTITSGKIVQGEFVLGDSVETPLGELPNIQAIVKGQMDRDYSRPVLQYIRYVVTELLQKVPALRRQ